MSIYDAIALYWICYTTCISEKLFAHSVLALTKPFLCSLSIWVFDLFFSACATTQSLLQTLQPEVKPPQLEHNCTAQVTQTGRKLTCRSSVRSDKSSNPQLEPFPNRPKATAPSGRAWHRFSIEYLNLQFQSILWFWKLSCKIIWNCPWIYPRITSSSLVFTSLW